jgi:hypothetical protein
MKTYRERHHIEQNKDTCLNWIIPTRSKKEYYDDNKESIALKTKEYNQIPEVKERKAIQKRDYRLKNEVISAKKKEYRERNQERLTEKINCECGGSFQKQHKSRHLKQKKHLEFINSKQSI